MATDIDRDEVQRLVAAGAQLVEVMPARDYREQGHLPKAISIPLKDIDERVAERLDPARPVVVYCYDFQ